MQHGFGGMLAFDIGTCLEDAKQFIDHLQVICHAVSLGATESLICIPYLTTLLYMPAERRTVFGVRQHTIRLSAGIEKTTILLHDLEQALNKLQSRAKPAIEIQNKNQCIKNKDIHANV
jgi:cystathionine beta-lyase/cystathionine gamma-synthase